MTPVVLLVVVLIALLLAVFAVKVVGEHERGVVFRNGRLVPGSREPGLYVLVPGLDKMVKVNLSTTKTDLQEENLLTKDGTLSEVSAELDYRITDPVTFVREVGGSEGGDLRSEAALRVMQAGKEQLRTLAASQESERLLADKEALAEELREAISTTANEFGVGIESVEIEHAG